MRFTANRLCVLLAAWMVLLANHTFWSRLFDVQGQSGRALLFAASLFLTMLGLNLLLLRLLTPGRSLRVGLTLLVLLAAAAGWFIDTYGVALDSDMLRNVYQTNLAEARDFLGWPLLWRLLWQAGPPIALIWMVQLPQQGWLPALRDYALGAVAGAALILLAGLPLYSSYVSYFRNERAARYLLVPANVVVGSTRLLRKALHRPQPHAQVGLDARRIAAPQSRPLLIVVVVGETARAANFSLGGYARDTNPQLRQRDIHYFSDVTSCGTSTAVALPCMFSDLPREEFDLSQASGRDSVLDILQRAGLHVTWIDNQSGCKKLCDRVVVETAEPYHPASCSKGVCLDETLLHALEARLQQQQGDAVLLLHAMGSHGPSYHLRVPPQWAKFQPTCATGRIETCSDAQIVNAYDNSILYTDHVLAAMIDRLDARTDVDSLLLYVSDHGESLGENGLYLHGQPFFIAPAVQKHVPMLMWFSDGVLPRLALDPACLRTRLSLSASHDNLSHTLLGMADVATEVYRPELDSLRPCRL